MEFEWNLTKAEINARKHDVTFSEAAEVFADLLSSTAVDPDHSDEEDRFVIFGKSLNGRHIVVSFTDRNDRIRIISARTMTPRERKAYEQ